MSVYTFPLSFFLEEKLNDFPRRVCMIVKLLIPNSPSFVVYSFIQQTFMRRAEFQVLLGSGKIKKT